MPSSFVEVEVVQDLHPNHKEIMKTQPTSLTVFGESVDLSTASASSFLLKG